MNYAGKFDGAISSDGPGNHSHFVHLNPGHVHAPADAIVVPDAHFLFNADFKRSGVDLILSSEDHELVLHEYFKGAKHKALASPDGAHLTGDLVDALTGHVELAQAGGATAAASAVIGHITKLAGSATVVRNGVSIILNMGDNVEKGDVVQSGSNTTVGITFIDGTVFGLSSNAKMVLNDMVYDPNGSNNSSLLSLVSGTITFVAGETAKHGDMKIDTPVATMGIRGTAVLVEIDFSVPGANGAPNASFQVLVEPDGTTGSYILFDKATMQPLAIVNQAGQQININNGVISQTQNPLTPEMQQLISKTFELKFSDNTNTKQNSTIGSSFTDNGITATLKFADNSSSQTTTQGTDTGPKDKAPPPSGPGGPNGQHVAGPPTASFTATHLFFVERPDLTGSPALDQMKFTVNFADPNPGDSPTVRADFTGFIYKDAAGHDVLMSPLAQQDVLAAEIDLNPALVAAAGNANNGSTDVLYSLADKDFDFLAQGEFVTVSYVITVNNNYGPNPEVTKQTVTFTIFGTNDVPVIADDLLRQLIEFKGGTSTSGGTLTVLHGEATGGTYDFKDPDLSDTHWIIDANKDPAINHTADPKAANRFDSVHKAALTSASLTLPDGTTLDKAGLEALAPGPMSLFEQALDVDVTTDSTGTGNGKITWQLDNLPVFLADFIPANETLKLYYTIEVTDENGATDTKVVEVDITGTNAAATVWVHTTDDGHDGNWTTGANWGTGKAPTSVDDVIIVTDQLHPHTPAYPATITTGTQAAAHSVVMNDFVVDNTQPVPQTIPPELKLETGSSLTIGTSLDMSADSILTNAGTVNIGTQLELKDDATNPVTPVNESVINNSGTINIGQGGDIQGVASVTNSGTIDLKSGTLNLDVNVANSANGSGGDIIVESGAKLVLGGDANTGKRGGVTGGTVTVNGGGELDFTGVNTLSSGTLSNTGQVNVSGLNNILSGETVSNTGNASAIDITSVLTAKSNTAITNTTATSGETIENGGTLTLQDTSSITSGQVTNKGTLNLQGTSSLKGGPLVNTGQINVSGTGNTLDGGEIVSNTGGAGAIDITGSLTLTNATMVLNTDSTSGETVESGGTLTLQDTTSISSGQVTNAGTLNLQGTSLLAGGMLTNTGQVNVSGSGVLLATETVSNTGNGSAIDITGTLTAQTGTTIANQDATSGETVESGGTLTLKDTSSISGGQVTNAGTLNLQGTTASLSSGKLTNTHQVSVSGSNNALTAEQVLNTGTASAIDITGTLTAQTGTTIANQDTTSGETIESGASLTLDDTSSISGGKVIDKGTLTLNGTSSLSNGILTNTAQVNAAGTNGLHNESVSNSGAGAIDITGDLTLDLGTAITNGTGSGGSNAETIESGASLTLDDTSSISGGKVIDKGTLTLNGTSSLSNGILTNTAQVNAAGTNGLHNESISNSGAGAIDITGDLTLDLGTAITNGTGSGGSNAETIESGASLTLDDTSSISGGKVIDKGTLTLNGTSSLSNGILTNTAQVNAAGTNGLHNESISNSGAGAIDITGDLTLDLGTAITNGTGSGGSNAETIESGASLTLKDTSSISGGKVIDKGTLTLNGTSSLSNGILTNTAQVNAAGTNGLHNESISNSGAGAIDITGDLTLDLGTAITNGTGSGGSNAETIESGASLTLKDTSSISGGQVTNKSGGTVNLQGSSSVSSTATNNAGTLNMSGTSSLSSGSLANTGTLNVSGSGNALHDETVTANNMLEVLTGAALMLDQGTSVANASGTVKVDATATLTLNDASITNGTVTNAGTINSAGGGAINQANITNTGTIESTSGTLTIDPSGPSQTFTLTNSNLVKADGGSLYIIDEQVTNTGTLEAINHGTLQLTGLTVTNTDGMHNGTVSTDGSSEIDLSNADISGGTVTNAGTINSTGGGEIEYADITNTGTIESTVGLMTIDGGSSSGSGPSQTFTLTNSNTVKADGGQLYIVDEQVANTGTLEAINNGTLKLTNLTVTNTDGTHDGTVSVASLSTLDLSDAHISGGSLSNAGTVYSTGISTIDAAITNDHSIEVGSGTLTLSGSITGAGYATIDGGATLDLASSFVDSQDVTFAGSGGELIIEGPAANVATSQNFTGDIHGFTATDEIDLRGISYGNPTYATYTYDATTGVLTVNDGNGSHYDLDIGLGYAGAHFAGSDDHHGGTLITMTVDDDLPEFGQTSLTANLSEQPDQTGSGVHDPVAPLTAGGTLNFSDVDLTDLPTVSIAPGGQSVSWTDTDGTTDLSASLSDTQKAALENALTLSAHNGNHNNGATDWNYSIADSTLDFLGEGQTLTITTTVVLDDHQGTTPLPTEQITVTITGANDAPQIAYSGGTTIAAIEDTSAAISGLSVSDPDSNAGPEQLTLHVDHGTLAVSTTDGVTGDFDGSDGSLTLTGSLADINAALSTLSYQAASNFSGTDDLHLSLDDQVPNAALTTTKDIAIGVTPVADTPTVATLTAGYSANADSTITLTGFTGVGDTDGSESLTLTLSNFPDGTTFSAGHFDQATGNWVVSATDIAGLHGAALTMTPPSDFGGTFSLHVDAKVTDTATLPGGPATDTKTFSEDFNVAIDKLTANDDSITDQPTFTENSDTSIATSVLLANDTDSLGNPITITSVGDIDHHSANGGTVTLNGNVITYTPATDFSGQDSFTYTISDGGQTSTATVTFDVAAPATGTTDEVWTAGVDGDWNDGGNWNQTRAPVASDNVYINDPVTVSDDLGDSDQSITQLHLMSSGAELDIISSTDAHSFVITGDETSATALQNAGLIDVDTFESDGAAVSMTVSGNVENSGTIQSDGLDATVTFGAVTVDNSNGTISSLDGGTVVFDGTTVSGGEISGDSSSTIEVGDSSFSAGVALTLQDGATVADEIMTIGSGDTLQIEHGSIGPGATLDDVSVTNNGTVQVDSAIDHPPQTILTLDDGTTITGGTLSIGSVGTVDVEVGQEGSGGTNGHDFDAQLDDVTVINSGTINVDLQAGGAVLNLADGTTITGGTLDIENSGEVYVQSGSNGDVTLDNVTVTNNGDGIEIGTFVAQGSTLFLDDGTTITGGTLTLEDTADVLDVVVGPSGPGGANGPGPDATLDGVAVTNYGTIEIGSGATLALDGGGSIALQDSQIVESGPGAELELFNGTIIGVGTVGDGNLTLLNDSGSFIEANSAAFGGTLEINALSFTNDGTLVAEDNGILQVDSTTNLTAEDDHIEEGLVLSGGSYVASGNGQINFTYLGHQIATLQASVTLDGGESEITTNGETLQHTLVEIGSNGSLTLNDASFADVAAGGLDVAGTVSLSGGTLSAYGLTVDQSSFGTPSGGGVVEGFGVISTPTHNDSTFALHNGGAIIAENGILEINAAIDAQIPGAEDPVGLLEIEGANATLKIDAGFNGAASIQNQTIQFNNDGANEQLVIDGSEIDGSNIGASIANFAVGDSIDLTGIQADGYTYNSGTHELDLTLQGNLVGSLTLTNVPRGAQFNVIDDGTGHGTLITEKPIVNITVYASDGIDFQDLPNPLSEMGSGTVQPGGAKTFTIDGGGSQPNFVVDGYGFTYDINGNITGGTITAIHDIGTDGSPIADFTGNFDAAQWMSGVQQIATSGDFTAINTMVANYDFDFLGSAGPDSFGGAGHNQNMSGGAGNDVFDPNNHNPGDPRTVTLTGGSGADTFVYKVGAGAVTITDFDQGNSGGFSPTEGDQIELEGLSNPVSLQQVGSNTIADFGNGDVLTFLNMTPAQVQSISSVVQPPVNGVAYNPPGGSGTLVLNPSSSQSFKIAGTAVSTNSGPGVTLSTGDNNIAHKFLVYLDQSSSVSTSGSGAAGININSPGASVDLVNNASVSSTSNTSGAVGINVGMNGPGNITLINTGNVNAGSAGIAANNFETATTTSSFIFVSNFGTIVAGANAQSNGVVANGIWAGYGNGLSPTTFGAVVVDNNADVTATSSLQGGASGIVAFNNSNGNVTVNEGSDTTVTGFKYGIQAVASNRGVVGNNNSVVGAGSASGDVTINLSQNVTVSGTNAGNGTYGIFAENFNNLEGNITVNMAAGDVINSQGAGINAYDGATSLPGGTILVNAEGTINSGTFLNGNNTGQPAGILAGYLGTPDGSTPGTAPVPGLNGSVIINSAADITAAGGDGIRGYTYGTGDVTINATAGEITALYLNNPSDGSANGYGDGISAQNIGPGSISVTTAAAVAIHAGGSGIAANNGDNGNVVPVSSNSLISITAYGLIESGMNSSLKTGSGVVTAGILAGYNATSNTSVTPNVHGNVVIDDHATITADVGDGVRGYNFGDGNVTITVEDESTVQGARYGAAGFTYDGGHINLTNYGSITGAVDAIDVNFNGVLPITSGTATVDNHGDLIGNIVGFNATVTNEMDGDWSMNGISTFTGTSTLTNFGTIESTGTSTVSGLTGITNVGTIEVQSGSLDLSGPIVGTGTLKIDAGSTLELASSVASGQTVMFGTDAGVLKLDDPLDFHGTIAGISHTSQTDILRLEGLSAGHTITASSGTFDSVHDTTTLTILDGSSALMTFTLDGDYSTSTWIVTDKGGGEYDIVDPPAPSGQLLNGMIVNDPGPAVSQPTVIADGATAHVSAPSSETVTFTGATGSLLIDDPADFNGHISGFTGTAPDAEHSDTIDLVGIDFNSTQFDETYNASTGLLSVTDGSHAASFTFDNFKATLDFASDGKGGTLITDPPATGVNAQDFIHTVLHDLDPNGSFVFNPSGPGQQILQHVFEEISEALAPLKDILHLPGQTGTSPYGSSATMVPQVGAVDPAALHDSLKQLLSHTDLHL